MIFLCFDILYIYVHVYKMEVYIGIHSLWLLITAELWTP